MAAAAVVQDTIDRRKAAERENDVESCNDCTAGPRRFSAKEWSGEGMCKLRGVSPRTAGSQS